MADQPKIPTSLAELNNLPSEVHSFLPDLGCMLLLASPNGLQALIAIKAAKEAGLIRDEGHCKELAENAEELAKILGGTIAGLIAGKTASCACEQVF